ncbi:MAG: sodium:glutamate symporter [Kiritimatiellae bacterium]|nr:sodium:glutamate symporter [Kiritimatiellia bacterium]
MDNAIIVFSSLCTLLFVGKLLRINCPVFQRLYLPSSVIGGLIGLTILSTCGKWIPAAIPAAIGKIPGFLINIIFATIFLGTVTPRLKDVVRLAFPQLVIGQLLAWGQYVVGLGLAGFALAKLFPVPPAFGNLLEIGFEGGHGTVGGMAKSFTELAWPDGLALGFTVATLGMIIGVVLGMILIQWAHKRGYVKEVRAFEERRLFERRGLHLRRNRPSAGHQTVMSDSIDSLAWHLTVVGLAVLIGYGIFHFIPLKGLPLFPFCMIGGVIMEFIARTSRKSFLVDRVQMERIAGSSLDFLVVAAISTIKLSVVAKNWIPLTLLVLAGTLYTVFIVLVIARRVFRKNWFECAIAEFGQATGVTATGLMLLRTVDPDNKTSAAISFGYKQLLHEPFMGGGLWTALALPLVYRIGWMNVWLISLGMLLLWAIAAGWLIRKNR